MSLSTNSAPSHEAAPVSIMLRASDIEAPTVRIRPHDSLLSNCFQVSVPMRGTSSTIAAIKAGIAGERWCQASVSHSSAVSGEDAERLDLRRRQRLDGGPSTVHGPPLSNGPTIMRSQMPPRKISA